MFSAKLYQCFDSHLHWQATGDWAHRLDLSQLSSAEDISHLKIKPEYFRGKWLRGFGWDHHNWPEGELPTRDCLDKIFPDYPVAFSRADGHATWVNTRALQLSGLLTDDSKALPDKYQIEGGRVVLNTKGMPTGVLLDKAKSLIDRLIPAPSPLEIRSHLVEAMRLFHRKGFTHIRDMTCNENQWNQALHLDESGLLKLGVLQTFSAEDPKDFHKALNLARNARKNHSPHLKPHGIKIFYDGALGSEGALLSQSYCSGSGKGFRLLSPKELKEIMREVWLDHWDFAIHTIGDEAVAEVVSVACEVWNEGINGRLHLEHAEVIRDETIQAMKGRPIICHIQPSHWLTDRKWAKQKLGSLYECIFPWQKLEQAGIQFYFGSDSPIEPVGVEKTLEALELATADGIAPIKTDPLIGHQLNDQSWMPNTYTVFENGEVKELVFEGEHLI